MIPTRIYLKNFMNHIESDIDCTNFNSALIVAKNPNDDGESNGLGKTTIFTAIAYALFGKVSTSVLEKSIREGQEKCEVEFEFILNDEKYKIQRSRSKTISSLHFYKLSPNNVWEPLSGRASESDEKISKLIKINYNSFFHSVNFSQYDLQGLVSTKKAADREKILKEPLNLEIYAQLEKLARSKRGDLKKEEDQMTGSISVLGDPKESLKILQSECERYETLLVEEEDELSKISKLIIEKNKEYNNLKNALSKSDNDFHEKISSLTKKTSTISDSIKSYESKIENLRNKKDSLSKDIELQNNKLSIIIETLEDLNGKEIDNVEELNIKLDKINDDETLGNKLLSKYEAEYDHANKSIPKDDVCSLCNQDITKEYRLDFEEKISKVLEEKSTQISNVKRNLTKCKNAKVKVIEKIKESKTIISSIKDNENNKKHLEESIAKDSSYINKYLTDISNYNTELFSHVSEFNTLNSELKVLKDKVSNSGDSGNISINKKMLAVSEEIKHYTNNLESIRNDIINIKGKEAGALENIKISKANIKKIATLKQEKKIISKKVNAYNIVVNNFSSGGIPRFMIYSILDDLQFETNTILSSIRPYIQVQFDDELNLNFNIYDTVREYDALSIGQKIYIAFALKMGYSKVIQKKLGINIQFLLLDEVDQSLDKLGVEAYIDVIKKLQEDFKCFVITHNESLKDKFSHAILVEGDVKNGSRATVTTSW